MTFFILPLELRQQIYKELLHPTQSNDPVRTYVYCACNRPLPDKFMDDYHVDCKDSGTQSFTNLSTTQIQAMNRPFRSRWNLFMEDLPDENNTTLKPHLNILRVCRAIYEEALPFLYKDRILGIATVELSNVHHKEVLYRPDSRAIEQWDTLVRFLERIGEKARNHVRYVHIIWPLLTKRDWDNQRGKELKEKAYDMSGKLVSLLPILKRMDVNVIMNWNKIYRRVKSPPLSSYRQYGDVIMGYTYTEGEIDCITPLELFYGLTRGFKVMNIAAICNTDGFSDIEHFDKTKRIVEEGIKEQLDRMRLYMNSERDGAVVKES